MKKLVLALVTGAAVLAAALIPSGPPVEAATRWLATVWMIMPTVGGGWMPMLRSSLTAATRLPDRAAVVGRLGRSPVMAHSTSRTRGLSS